MSTFLGNSEDCYYQGPQPSDKNKELSRGSLMPEGWENSAPKQVRQKKGGDDWRAYAPSKKGCDEFLTISGSARHSFNSRNNASRLGYSNLLRSQILPQMSQTEPWFGGSSQRDDYKSGIGNFQNWNAR